MEKLPCFEHTVWYMRLQTYITKIHSQIQFGEGCVSTNNWRTYTHTHRVMSTWDGVCSAQKQSRKALQMRCYLSWKIKRIFLQVDCGGVWGRGILRQESGMNIKHKSGKPWAEECAHSTGYKKRQYRRNSYIPGVNWHQLTLAKSFIKTVSVGSTFS